MSKLITACRVSLPHTVLQYTRGPAEPYGVKRVWIKCQNSELPPLLTEQASLVGRYNVKIHRSVYLSNL